VQAYTLQSNFRSTSPQCAQDPVANESAGFPK